MQNSFDEDDDVFDGAGGKSYENPGGLSDNKSKAKNLAASVVPTGA